MANKQIAIEGQCPYCEHTGLYYQAPKVVMRSVIYKALCPECNKSHDELHAFIFTGQRLDDGTEIEAERKATP